MKQGPWLFCPYCIIGVEKLMELRLQMKKRLETKQNKTKKTKKKKKRLAFSSRMYLIAIGLG